MILRRDLARRSGKAGVEARKVIGYLERGGAPSIESVYKSFLLIS